MAIVRSVLRPILRHVLYNIFCDKYGAGGGGVTPSTPEGAFSWLGSIKTWAASQSTSLTTTQQASLGLIIKL